MALRALRQGEVFWLDDCPPLEGDVAKRRPVIVVTPPQVLTNPDAVVVVVAVTTRGQRRPTEDEVRLPSRASHEHCTTGLTKPSWAVCRWALVLTSRDRLGRRLGYVSGDTLARVLAGLERFLDAGGSPRRT